MEEDEIPDPMSVDALKPKRTILTMIAHNRGLSVADLMLRFPMLTEGTVEAELAHLLDVGSIELRDEKYYLKQ